jgi:predicted Zn-ribbon and HTH transcriptional regulator
MNLTINLVCGKCGQKIVDKPEDIPERCPHCQNKLDRVLDHQLIITISVNPKEKS